MNRLILAVMVLAQGFVVISPDGAGLVPGTTTLATCTASAVLYADASKVVQCNGPAFETSTGVGISATPITGAKLYILQGSASGATYSSSNTSLVMDGNATYFQDFLGVATSTVGFRFDNATDSAAAIVNDGSGTGTPGLRLAAGGVDLFGLRAAGGWATRGTITAGGTTGNQTISKMSGTVNFAAAATAITVTNTLVSTSSAIVAVARTNDATCAVKNVVPGAGSFVITMTAACTAETSVAFLVFNPNL